MAPNPNLGWQPTKSSGTKPPKPPTSGSNAVKPNPNYIPPASIKENCTYETPCGWCTKRDKKCDKKIGPEVMPVLKMPDHAAENIIEDVKNRMYESCGVSENLIKETNK
jgi:hypothetical protein